jgi:thioredoxin 1
VTAPTAIARGDGRVLVGSDDAFASDVLGSELPVVVDFGALWCGPCRIVRPVLEELAVAYAGRVTVVSMDTEVTPATVAAYGIASIPTILFFSDGVLVREMTGARPKAELAAGFDALLAVD